VDERIYHGASPGESEIGHVRLDKSGTIVEHRCSGWAVDRRVSSAVGDQPGSALARAALNLERGQARALVPALLEKCPVAQAILAETADDLAFGLSHVTHLVHPETIVLGGGLSFIGEPLRDAVHMALSKYVMDAFVPGPRVALAVLREDAVPVGALLLAAGSVDQA